MKKGLLLALVVSGIASAMAGDMGGLFVAKSNAPLLSGIQTQDTTQVQQTGDQQQSTSTDSATPLLLQNLVSRRR
jgi:hypothetical protein